jgi:hypothetical protein
MTVGQLIKLLQKFNKELPVLLETGADKATDWVDGERSERVAVWSDSDGVFIGSPEAIQELEEGL